MLTHRGVFVISLRLCTVCSDIAVFVQGAPEPALWHAVTAIARDRRAIDIENKENACATYILYICILLAEVFEHSSPVTSSVLASRWESVTASIDIGSGASTLHVPCAPLHQEELPGEE